MSLPIKKVDGDISSEVSTIAVTSSNATSRRESESRTLPPLEVTTPKKTSHIDRNDLIRDAIIGFADGLTVPFALTAGLST